MVKEPPQCGPVYLPVLVLEGKSLPKVNFLVFWGEFGYHICFHGKQIWRGINLKKRVDTVKTEDRISLQHRASNHSIAWWSMNHWGHYSWADSFLQPPLSVMAHEKKQCKLKTELRINDLTHRWELIIKALPCDSHKPWGLHLTDKTTKKTKWPSLSSNKSS